MSKPFAIANIQPRFVVAPPQIVLPPGPLSNAFPCTVSIRHNGGEPLTLSDPEVNAKDVSVGLNTVAPDRQFAVTLSFPAGFQLPEAGLVELSVKTSDEKHPVIKVPIRQGGPNGLQGAGLRPQRPGPPPMPLASPSIGGP